VQEREENDRLLVRGPTSLDPVGETSEEYGKGVCCCTHFTIDGGETECLSGWYWDYAERKIYRELAAGKVGVLVSLADDELHAPAKVVIALGVYGLGGAKDEERSIDRMFRDGGEIELEPWPYTVYRVDTFRVRATRRRVASSVRYRTRSCSRALPTGRGVRDWTWICAHIDFAGLVEVATAVFGKGP
jgi:hypothetical protein